MADDGLFPELPSGTYALDRLRGEFEGVYYTIMAYVPDGPGRTQAIAYLRSSCRSALEATAEDI